MSPEAYNQVRKIVEQALEQPERNRNLFIEALCAGKPELLEQVRRQLSLSNNARRILPTRRADPESSEIPTRVGRLETNYAGMIPATQRIELPDSGSPIRIGRYEIKSRIGEGGMGWVYKAWDPFMGRDIAIKTIRIGGDIDFSANRESLLSEMKVGARLGGIPGIVTFYDAGVDDEGGIAYIAMEFVEGPSLQKIIRPGEPLEPARALDILKQSARALDEAHGRRVVHCDVKPANILLHNGVTVKITDFGISRFREPGMTQRTVLGEGMGTPQYISPEQFALKKSIDGRSDQYSLAVVAFQLLTGQLPLNAPTYLMFQANASTGPLSASAIRPDLPVGVDAPLRRSMEIEPSRRFERCAEFVEALEAGFRNRAFAAVAGVTERHPDPDATRATHPHNLDTTEGTEEAVHSSPKPSRKTKLTLLLSALAIAALGAVYGTIRPYLRPGPVPSVTSFAAEPSKINQGDSAVLRWDVKNADYVVIDQGIGKVAPSGYLQVRPGAPTAYTLNAKGKGGDISAKAGIEVIPKTTPASAPSVTRFEVTPAQIKPGESATLRWEISGADTVVIDNGVGQVPSASSGSVQVTPAADTEYTLTATGKGGVTPANVSIAVLKNALPDAATLLRSGKDQLARHEDIAARDSFFKAAQAGSSEGMVLLGVMESQGLGGPKDSPDAVRWFEQAAGTGNARGMYNLGLMYANGQGVPRSPVEAANWYSKAIKGGSRDAAYRLGMMYEQGVGVPRNPDKARELYEKAGTDEAKLRLSMLPRTAPERAPDVSAPRVALILQTISPPAIKEGQSRQYMLAGSGFTLHSVIRLDVPAVVGSQQGKANNLPLEVAPGGAWLRVYIEIPAQTNRQSVQVIIRNPDGQQVRIGVPVQP